MNNYIDILNIDTVETNLKCLEIDNSQSFILCYLCQQLGNIPVKAVIDFYVHLYMSQTRCIKYAQFYFGTNIYV